MERRWTQVEMKIAFEWEAKVTRENQFNRSRIGPVSLDCSQLFLELHSAMVNVVA